MGRSSQFRQALQHRVQRRDPDAPGDQHTGRSILLKCEMISRFTDGDNLPNAQFLVDMARATAAVAILEDCDRVLARLIRMYQRIAAYQTRRQVKVDVGSSLG